MEVRVDTYLWAIRVFKTRSMASNAIKGGKVKLEGNVVKASKMVKPGETYSIIINKDHTRIIKVINLIDKRHSFQIAKEYFEDLTPIKPKSERLEDMFYKVVVKSEKGSGRPTKKDRRDLKKKGGWF
ncbi:MAG: RNA-binding S4 domain-containing protein [Bacteroidia bacterium]